MGKMEAQKNKISREVFLMKEHQAILEDLMERLKLHSNLFITLRQSDKKIWLRIYVGGHVVLIALNGHNLDITGRMAQFPRPVKINIADPSYFDQVLKILVPPK